MKPQESKTSATSDNKDSDSQHVWETYNSQVSEYLSYWITPLASRWREASISITAQILPQNLTGNLRH